VYTPTVPGVPTTEATDPLELSPSPEGSDPEVIAKEYGAIPPEAEALKSVP